MTKKLLLVFTILLFSRFLSFALEDKIVYVLSSDSLEYEVINEINVIKDVGKLDQKEGKGLAVYIFRYKNQLCIDILPYTTDHSSRDFVSFFANRTNRYFLAGDNLYPLIFDYDFEFGTTSPINSVGETGNRDGLLKRCCLILENDDFIKIKELQF